MQVVILCGGYGTRLREETEFRPKPMVPVGNRPILWHIMKIYAHYGHKNFVLPLGYKGEMIKDYFYRYELMNNDVHIELGKSSFACINSCHEEHGWDIILSNTGLNTLKGARLKRVEKYITSDNFMVTYGDGVSNVNISDLIDFHMKHGKIATLTGVSPASRFGEIIVEGDNVKEFTEKPQSTGGLINGGFFVFTKKIFEYLDDIESCDLEYGPLGKIATEGELMVYHHDDFWACMDTVRDMEYLNRLWTQNKAVWKVW
ncbi:MAG: glucose-1-phosphate cytidylyltransferase [Desulfobacteraceae bacterium]|nr:glucose-1-phosphate cytidylyltransferase [Desulfobacteraceae bacterium]